MSRITKYGKKLKLKYCKWALMASGAFACFFPWFDGISTTEEGYYSITLNDVEIGAVGDEQVAQEAYLEARLMIENENEVSVYIDCDLEVTKEDKPFGDKLSRQELTDKMYEILGQSSVEVKEKAYVVDIEGFKVTLGSKEDVIALLDAAKSKYDTTGQFSTVLTEATDTRFSSISYQFVNYSVEDSDNPVVMASEYGVATAQNANKVEEGITKIGFEEEVEIVETYVSGSQITKLEDAIELVTKEKEENKVYEVQEGDTLSAIAVMYELSLEELLAMNPDYSEEGYINIGDRLNVTVPKPELSVVVTEKKSYNENYSLPVEYVYNDTQYTTYSNVLNEGSEGYRAVVADVTYVNGVEVSRTIVQEEVVTPATAQVIEVGTLTPPTFIKPISGGRLSSPFGPRWGTVHYGVDWACSTGTSVMASCGGTVTQAGWNGGYGYCITISHGNGMQTRYAHLSSVLVSSGEYVTQGQVIGLSGNTGNSTGPHLHFEVIEYGTKVNPFSYLN